MEYNNMKKIGRNAPCWCGSGKKYKKCHMAQDIMAGKYIEDTAGESQHVRKGTVSPARSVPAGILRPDYAETGMPKSESTANIISTPEEIERMRNTCHIARQVLDIAKSAVRPGITTEKIDAITHKACLAQGAYPSPLNYRGYPKSVCTSVNEIICHGIPDDRPLEDGDIVNIDVTIYSDGVHGDCSETLFVGNVDSASQNLVNVTRECMMLGIEAVRPSGLIRDIGRTIQQHARKHGYSIVRAYAGHGIGAVFHNQLMIPHNYDIDAVTEIEPGMIFTVEPMINMGTWQHIVWGDKWTAVTADLQRSAQFENTILVTDNGSEILTK